MAQLDSGSLLARLRQAIVRGAYTPGSPLSEVTLSEAFNVSRTPVREALKQLQSEGLVEIRPRVGTFVRQASRREIVEMFELKETLEGLAAKLLARRGHIPELDTLGRNLSDSEAAVERGDDVTYAQLVHEFHQLLIDGSDNTKLSQHYRTLMNQLAYHRLVLTSLSHKGRPSNSLNEHRRVFSLIQDKDSVGAELAMRGHVAASAREVLADSVITEQDRTTEGTR